MFKKILIWLIVILAAILVILVVIGLMNPKYNETVSVTIDAPIEKAWAIFDDLDHQKHWVPGFVSAELVEGEPKAVGSKYQLNFEQNGEAFSMVETVTEYTPGESIAFDLTDPSGTFNIAISLEEDGDKTRVTEVMKGEPRGIFGKALTYIMKGQIQQHKLSMYQNLKEHVENTEWEVPNDSDAVEDKTVMDSVVVDTI